MKLIIGGNEVDVQVVDDAAEWKATGIQWRSVDGIGHCTYGERKLPPMVAVYDGGEKVKRGDTAVVGRCPQRPKWLQFLVRNVAADWKK